MTRKPPLKTPEKPADPRRDYVVTESGWIAGARRAKGETLTLHPREAKYEARLVEAPASAAAKEADAK